MSRAADILAAMERNPMAMPVDLREEYKTLPPTREKLWPLAVLLASWQEREPTIGGIDLSPYWPIVDSVIKTYPLLEVFLRRVKESRSDLDLYAAGAVYALLVKAVGVRQLRTLLSQPIVDRIREVVPLPSDSGSTRPPPPDAPDRARRLSESPIRRFDAPRFTSARKTEPDPAPSSVTPIDAEYAELPAQDPQTIAAGVLAMRGWSPEQIAEKLKGPRRG
jgi:hypothetical protein